MFNDFTRKYSLSKTLRFELKPVPETKSFLKKFIESDTQRSKDYQKLKNIIDEFHKDQIQQVLSQQFILDIKKLEKLRDSLEKLKKLQKVEDKKSLKKSVDKLQQELRKEIVNKFKTEKYFKCAFKDLFEKKLITEILPKWIEQKYDEKEREEKIRIISQFNKFTTYLTDFQKNRKNMYSDGEESTAIAYRVINENFPKFLSNCSIYQNIINKYPKLHGDCKNRINRSLKSELNYFKAKSIDHLFKIECYNQCLSQKGIDNYNTIVGGKKTPEGEKIQGINEKINLHRQQSTIKRNELPNCGMLYKQILSDRESHSFTLEGFESGTDVIQSIKELYKTLSKINEDHKSSLFNQLWILLTQLSENDIQMDKIYFNSDQLSALSIHLFGNWHTIKHALESYAMKEYKNKKEQKSFSKSDFFSFQSIHEALVHYKDQSDEFPILNVNTMKEGENYLLHYFKNIDKYLLQKIKETKKDDNVKLQTKNNTIPNIMDTFYNVFEAETRNYVQKKSEKQFSKKEMEAIKNFLDIVMDIIHLIKPMVLEKNKKKIDDLDKDIDFYNRLENIFEGLKPVIKIYNQSRNYIATNKNRLKKIKINFEDSTLLDGWDVNKEADNLSVILRKKEQNRWLYYLGVMNTENKKIFDYCENFDDQDKPRFIDNKKELRRKIIINHNADHYEKMNYKLLPDPSRMLPKVFFSKKRKSYFNPSEEIEKIKKEKTYAKNDGKDFNKENCHKLVDFYKNSIQKHYDWKQFNFKFSRTENYKDISDFYHEVSAQGYGLSFDKIKSDYIQEKVKKGELYLFKIYNKDFSRFSKGNPNLHTKYFHLLFNNENLTDTVLKLNGKAEVFYRKSSMKKKVTHLKNQPIQNKNPLNPKTRSTFKYDLIKDKRFTEDKFFIHIPIKLNFKSKGINSYQFNQKVCQLLKNNPDVNIIGIDRGERHLAYYSVVNQKGEILEQDSFNTIQNSYQNREGDSVEVKTNYHGLLEDREKERDRARKSWSKIESIKELKSGMLSHLVHKITKLMVHHNAIVIFEDLNPRFKNSRKKFEKQVYQKLEKALIDKLNYLVFKDSKHLTSPGGYLNAYQLTAPFETFSKIGTQTGFIFYTPAYYTSKVDPSTGFVSLVYPKYQNIGKAQKLFKNFDKIYFDSKKGYFVFKYQDGKVNSSRKSETNAIWKVCTFGEDRYSYCKTSKSTKKVNVTEELKSLFKKYDIQFQNKPNLIEEICIQNEKSFFERLIYFLRVTVQLRYTNQSGTEDDEKDFILSPVADKKGRFFDSRKAKNNEPKNADANGAYHIALKGLLMLSHLHFSTSSDRLKITNIKNKEWFNFIQNRKNL